MKLNFSSIATFTLHTDQRLLLWKLTPCIWWSANIGAVLKKYYRNMWVTNFCVGWKDILYEFHLSNLERVIFKYHLTIESLVWLTLQSNRGRAKIYIFLKHYSLYTAPNVCFVNLNDICLVRWRWKWCHRNIGFC